MSVECGQLGSVCAEYTVHSNLLVVTRRVAMSQQQQGGAAASVRARLGGEVAASLGLQLLNLGRDTGLWEALRGGARLTPAQLAERAGLSER